MRERGREQVGIGKFVPDARLQRGGRGLGAGAAALLARRSRLGAALRRRAQRACGLPGLDVRGFVFHRTILNSLFQRTDTGQRQKAQACSPSAMEKKIIWARPTTFSSGT